KVLPVHAMVDTGMGRQGFGLETAARDLLDLRRFAGLRLEGIATHYPVADSTGDPFTAAQITRLKGLLAALKNLGVDNVRVHGANSAGVIDHPDPVYTLARPGIMCMGVWPTDQIPTPNPIRPVLRWVTHVAQVRTLPPGHSVSYGRTYITEGGMTAAMLPVGYADGYRLAFSNKAEVLIRGQRCPVRGRVCMDQTVVDVSHVPEVARGDEVALAGSQGEDAITLEELAAHASTIPYEILTGIGRRVKRVYVN
ncbi:MAG: alanine racemase, partial [Planctomycetes bacterium]|nr:alanine racemase [Planctomycetota bacterium]